MPKEKPEKQIDLLRGTLNLLILKAVFRWDPCTVTESCCGFSNFQARSW